MIFKNDFREHSHLSHESWNDSMKDTPFKVQWLSRPKYKMKCKSDEQRHKKRLCKRGAYTLTFQNLSLPYTSTLTKAQKRVEDLSVCIEKYYRLSIPSSHSFIPEVVSSLGNDIGSKFHFNP